MQDIIKKIVDMDEKARKVKAEAEQEKADAQKMLAKEKQQIRDEYIKRAKIRAEKNARSELEAAEAQWAETQKKHNAVRKNLEKEFADNLENWSDQIFSKVLQQP